MSAPLPTHEERCRALVAASAEVFYRMSPDWSEMRELGGGAFLADTDRPSPAWVREYIHPDDQPRVLAAIVDAVRAGTVFELEHRVLRADGTPGWTASRAVPVRNAAGEVVEWYGAASDITARKRAEDELARLAQENQKAAARRASGDRVSMRQVGCRSGSRSGSRNRRKVCSRARSVILSAARLAATSLSPALTASLTQESPVLKIWPKFPEARLRQ